MTSKVYEGRARIELIHGDCIEGMATMNDKQFDLAIVDPEYFSGPEKKKYYGERVSSKNVRRVNYHTPKKWEVPDSQYFKELSRVSIDQIVWGINYFNNYMGPGRIIWDKVNKGSSYSDCEIAFCSKHDSVRQIRYMWNGMMQGKSISEGHLQRGNKSLNEKRIHQCQKPVDLYKWLLANYAEINNEILDTHGGSMSLAIACWDMGYNLTCYELDKQYYNDSLKRFESHISQQQLF